MSFDGVLDCCGCPIPDPPCPEPEAICVYVRERCQPFTPIAGATVTVRDTTGTYPDAQDTTDSEGYVCVELDGPGTYDVEVTVGDCSVTYDNVVVQECERKQIPDQFPCCAEVCYEVYDGHTGSPIEGATVSSAEDGCSGTTDSEGKVCCPGRVNNFVSKFAVTADGYIDSGTRNACYACDCDVDRSEPIALWPKSIYVASCYGSQHGDCNDPEPCDNETRPPWILKKTLYADFSGPEPIFGSGASGLELNLITGDDECPQVWEGTTAGGYAEAVTRVYNASTGLWTETGRERYDFPAARVRIRQIFSDYSGDTYLEWANLAEVDGELVDAGPGLVLSTSGTPGTTGYTEVLLSPIVPCDHPLLGYFNYPFKIRNCVALRGTSGTGISCQPSPTAWFGIPGGVAYGCGSYGVVGRGLCAPTDVSGDFWCGICLGDPYQPTETATYAIYE